MKTFRIGGVYPDANKWAKDCAIESYPLPQQAIVFLTQGRTAPTVPMIQKGDKVKVGQLLGKAETFICANVHSPFSGTVVKVEPMADITGYKRLAAVIDVEGDEWDESINRSDELDKEIRLSKEEIVKRIRDCGIVGLGGACFPTHVKYTIPENRKVDYLIINAVECEPTLTPDYRIMLERGEECLVGIKAMLLASGASMAKIGIEDNKPEAIRHLQELAANEPDIEVVPLKTKYPQGAEKQLIQALTGRIVPDGKLPIDVGCVVNNIMTAHAIYEAVQKNKPLIETYVSVSGRELKNCKNYRIRIGTPIDEVLNTVGLPEGTGKIIDGGPMTGIAIANIHTAFTKGMSGILLIDKSQSERRVSTECIRCGKCIEACPMGLEPYLFYRLLLSKRYDDLEEHKILNCIECGCCQSSCPAYLPLLDAVKESRLKVRMNKNEKH